jgi:hypothetical protein
MITPRVAIIQFRGLEGCGVTAYSRHLLKYLEAVGSESTLFCYKSLVRVGRPDTSKDVSAEYFTNDDLDTLTTSINSYDLCLIFSVPQKGVSLGDVYIEKCIKKIEIPKWFVQHDHHVLSFNRNASFDELIELCDGVLCHSLRKVRGGFIDYLDKKGLKPRRLEKLDIFFHVPLVENLINTSRNNRKKRLISAGRFASWKNNHALMDTYKVMSQRGFISEMIGYERSLGALSMFENYSHLPFWVNLQKTKEMPLAKRPGGCATANGNMKIMKHLDEVGQSPDLFYCLGPYPYFFGMKRLAESAFAFHLRSFEYNGLDYGNNPEFQTLEAMLLGIAVIGRHFAETTTLPGVSDALSDTDVFVIADLEARSIGLGGTKVANQERLADDLERIWESDYESIRAKSVDLVMSYYSSETVIPKLLGKLLS